MDGICDDVDACIGAFDACGVCNGDGSLCAGCTDPNACNYTTFSAGAWSTNFGLNNDPDVKTITVTGLEGDYAFEGELQTFAIMNLAGGALELNMTFEGQLTVDGQSVEAVVSAPILLPNGLTDLPESATFTVTAGEASWLVTATLTEDLGDSCRGASTHLVKRGWTTGLVSTSTPFRSAVARVRLTKMATACATTKTPVSARMMHAAFAMATAPCAPVAQTKGRATTPTLWGFPGKPTLDWGDCPRMPC